MNRRSFTIIEMLLVTLLAVMLLVGVLSVTSALGRTNAAWKQVAALDEHWQMDTVQCIAQDLRQAAAIEVSPNQINLTGLTAVDRSTMEFTQLPCQVVYQVTTASDPRGAGWLIRRQLDQVEGADKDPWTELVCGGVASLELQPVSVAQASGGSGLKKAAKSAGPQLIETDIVRLILKWKQANLVPTQVDLILR